MLVVTRFRVPASEVVVFRAGLEIAHATLSRQKGYLDGHVGRNVDDPELWVLETRWEGAGAYRRALSSYDVKTEAWALLGQAIDEPTAYELVLPEEQLNDAQPRETV